MEKIEQLFACPICKHSFLSVSTEVIKCSNSQCHAIYPIVQNIPVLINESNSIFSIADFVQGQETTFKHAEERKSKLIAGLKKLVPTLSNNLVATNNYALLLNLLKQKTGEKKVLVIGGGIVGVGMKDFLEDTSISFIETDVSFGPRTTVICDGHDLPFKNQSFDLVIVQAVLEHVLDPVRCVAEIHRVLKDDGLVYAETPFMQQVHMREFDFTRYTHLGHRRLFRHFEEINSGPIAGPGVGLAWAYSYFLMSFTSNRMLRNLLKVFSMFTAFFWKYFDYILIKKPGAYDAASAFYFIGKKSNTVLSDKSLIQQYKGSM